MAGSIDNMIIPVTEQSNPITRNVDREDSKGIVSCLYNSDCQIFEGIADVMGFPDPAFRENVLQAARELMKLRSEAVSGANVRVIMAGCGTSGRIAFIMSRYLNSLCRAEGHKEIYDYLIAGGDKALFTSQEAPEDNPVLGAQDLIQATAGCTRVLYIGITCGLSAPYVAGQLDHCLKQADVFNPILIGFNPSNLARKTPIKTWKKKFHDLVKELEQSPSAIILNPVVGAESITGSSRMKGGTATKIILDLIHLLAEDNSTEHQLGDILQLYRNACVHLYKHNMTDLSRLIDIAGQCLLSGGRVIYCGRDTDGIIAMVDASECVPTYGSNRDDIRGFMDGGYKQLNNKENDMSSQGSKYEIEWDDFMNKRGEQLKENDVIISFDIEALTLPAVTSSKAHKYLVSIGGDNHHQTLPEKIAEIFYITTSDLPAHYKDKPIGRQLSELLRCVYVKWICNCISTGAHILKGKVFGNIMVDVRVSNRKLYQRALGIIQRLCDCTKLIAEQTLQSVVFQQSTSELKSPDEVIEVANRQHLVLPHSLLMLLSNCSLEEARNLLKQEPIVRQAIQKYCKISAKH